MQPVDPELCVEEYLIFWCSWHSPVMARATFSRLNYYDPRDGIELSPIDLLRPACLQMKLTWTPYGRLSSFRSIDGLVDSSSDGRHTQEHSRLTAQVLGPREHTPCKAEI